MRIETAAMRTPVGPLAVAWTGDTLLAVHMDVAMNRTSWDTRYEPGGPMAKLKTYLSRRFPGVRPSRGTADAPVMRTLARYFAGEPEAIDELRVDPGGTEFQAAIWKALRDIPAGKTSTYGRLAADIGRPAAARAAGGAVGSNPVPIVVPCHRIVGADGRLTGFGGGLRRKRWLLAHEGVSLPPRTETLRLF